MYKPPHVGYVGPVTHSTYRTNVVYWLDLKKCTEMCKILMQIGGHLVGAQFTSPCGCPSTYQEACAMFPLHYPRYPAV
jgi:hypothetical protein